jgi:hypothetical protein
MTSPWTRRIGSWSKLKPEQLLGLMTFLGEMEQWVSATTLRDRPRRAEPSLEPASGASAIGLSRAELDDGDQPGASGNAGVVPRGECAELDAVGRRLARERCKTSQAVEETRKGVGWIRVSPITVY